MSGIPIGEAAFSGFQVIARKPGAVLVWGLVLFALTILPLMAMLGMMVPWLEEFASLAQTGEEPDPERFIALHLQMMALNPLFMITSLASRVLLTCAVFRVVLTPEDSRFFYLRLGLKELLVALVYLCMMIILIVLFIAGFAIAIGLGAATWALSEGAGIGLGLILLLALIGFVIWLSIRLSMAMPMTFAERRFRFFESWELTRGHTLSLFLIGLLAIVLLWLVEMVLIGLGAAIIIPVMLSRPFDEAALEAFFSRPPSEWMAAIAPWLLIGGLLLSIIGAALYTLVTAPWAVAYRWLTTRPAVEAAPPA